MSINLIDRALIAAALLFGAATLLYPFGGDQGLYFYVGREWLNGTVPYRDAMEQKTPLVFLLHALLVLLTGPNMWAIRVAELAWVVALGVAIFRLATPEGEASRPGVLGIACLSTSVLYFGLFNYWDTAQCEVWYAGLSVLSLWAVARRPAGGRSWLLGGLFGGLALLMKPPAAFLLVVVVAAMMARAYRTGAPSGRGLRGALASVLAFGAGAAAPMLGMALYFLCVDGMSDLIDIAFRANHHDMLHSATASNLSEVVQKCGDFSARTGPLGAGVLAVAVLGLAAGVHRRSSAAGRYAAALALLAAGVVAVAIQRKFYGYHWGALTPLMALPLACAVHDLGGVRVRRLSEHVSSGLAPALAAVLLAVGFLGTRASQTYATTVSLTAQYLHGRIEREQFLAPFVMENNTPYAHQEVVGRWIASHSTPDDLIAVRGFEQAIYAVADRRAPTRFFWTRWLTEPHRAYRRDEWLAQDLAALHRTPPRYVVVGDRAKTGPASRAHFEALGYAECFRHGRLIVLHKPAHSRPAT